MLSAPTQRSDRLSTPGPRASGAPRSRGTRHGSGSGSSHQGSALVERVPSVAFPISRDLPGLDWKVIRSLMRRNLVVDGRNALDRSLVSSLGFRCYGVGVPVTLSGRGDRRAGARRLGLHVELKRDLRHVERPHRRTVLLSTRVESTARARRILSMVGRYGARPGNGGWRAPDKQGT
jgi:hypothetical protein